MPVQGASFALICVGGGLGQRFGGDKLAERLGRRTVFERSLLALERAQPDAPLIAVCPEDRLQEWQQRLSESFPSASLVAGGRRRQDSVRSGVEATARLGVEVVVIHDAARPLVAPSDVQRAMAALAEHDGVVLCGRVADTVKRVAGDGRILETLPRDDLRLAQTPQVLRVSALQEVWRRIDWQLTWTDEAAMLEAEGMTVLAVEAQHANPKITSRHDLELIRALDRAGRSNAG